MILLGQPGVGKTHLCIAIGLMAIEQGHGAGVIIHTVSPVSRHVKAAQRADHAMHLGVSFSAAGARLGAIMGQP